MCIVLLLHEFEPDSMRFHVFDRAVQVDLQCDGDAGLNENPLRNTLCADYEVGMSNVPIEVPAWFMKRRQTSVRSDLS